jgi:hypothetical protein
MGTDSTQTRGRVASKHKNWPLRICRLQMDQMIDTHAVKNNKLSTYGILNVNYFLLEISHYSPFQTKAGLALRQAVEGSGCGLLQGNISRCAWKD